MPRGVSTIEISTPVSGARFDLPVHKLGPDMLAAGSFNVDCDSTNILKVRAGYQKLGAAPGPTKPLTGGISWEGANGSIYVIIADDSGWWAFNGTTGVWTPLTGAAPVGPDDFTRFAAMRLSGTDYLYGVNNNAASGLLQWQAGQNSITSVPGLPFQTALDCFVLANRLVVVGTTENGVFYPSRIRWSQYNAPTSFPADAVNDILDPGGGIVCGKRMGNLQAFIYMQGTEGTGALETMIAQVGDDANAFTFQEFGLGEGVVPPASAAAIIAVQGYHYYLGQDGRIWAFNGIQPQNFGIPIQSDIQQNANMAELRHSFAVYVPSDRHLRFFFPSGANSYPDRCEKFSIDFNRWEAPDAYTEQFRSGFTGPLSAATEQAAFLGGVGGGFYQLDQGTTDNGVPIPFNATWGVRNTSPLEKMQVQFAEAFIYQSNLNDVVALTVTGLRTPADASTGGVTYLMELSQANQFQQLSAPGIAMPGSTFYNWIQATLAGTTLGGVKCLGAFIQVNTMAKGVNNLRGQGPE